MNFEFYSQYYDLLYRDKDYRAESDYVISLLKKYSPDSHSLLELGCGTGKHAEYLCKNGYRVHGIERSADMLKIAATRKIDGFTTTQSDITLFSLDQKFDAAISLFHVISYLTEKQDLKTTFDNVARHLTKGGIFLFDVWHTEAVLFLQPEERIKQTEDEGIRIIRKTTPVNIPEQSRVDVHFDVEVTELASGTRHTFSELHPMKHFTIHEISLLADQSGFKLLGSEEFLTGNIPVKETWGVCHILKKI